VSNYTFSVDVKYYSQSHKGNSSKHERPYSDVLIVGHEPLHDSHISEWENEEELEHRCN
jgi:hypothetical protein